jgi:hypothetical protein
MYRVESARRQLTQQPRAGCARLSQPEIEGRVVSADRSHRFAPTGHDPEGGNRTIILWGEVDFVDGNAVRRVVTLDATMTTPTVLTFAQAVEVAQAILLAAIR